MALAKYLGRKLLWTLVVLFVALLLNFFLPRLIPGNPVDVIVANMVRGGGSGGDQLRTIHESLHAGVRARQAAVAAVLRLRREPAAGRPRDLVRRSTRRRSTPWSPRPCRGASFSSCRPSSSAGWSATSSAPSRPSRAGGSTGAPSSARCFSRACPTSAWRSSCCSSSACSWACSRPVGPTPSGCPRSSRGPSSGTPSRTSGCRSGHWWWSSSAGRPSACGRWPSTSWGPTTSTTGAASA